MSENACKLQLLDLYFSKYDFSLARGELDEEYKTSFKIEYAVSNSDDSNIKVTIDTLVINGEESVHLSLQTVAVFRIEKDNTDEKLYEQLIKQNTVAIIFPYIRSQVSLLTTQPGMKPIIIPPINIVALMNNSQGGAENNP